MRLTASIVLCLLGAACASSPSRPSDLPVIQIPDGRYLLVITPPAGFAGCSPAADLPFRRGGAAYVRLTLEGNDRVARAETTTVDGTVELRFSAVSGTAQEATLSGTIQGKLISGVGPDGYPFAATFGSAGTPTAPVTGTWISAGAHLSGQMTGTIVFSQTGQTSTTCTTSGWELLRG